MLVARVVAFPGNPTSDFVRLLHASMHPYMNVFPNERFLPFTTLPAFPLPFIYPSMLRREAGRQAGQAASSKLL